KLLQKLSEENINIMLIILNKSKVYTRLHDEKHVLYNYVVNLLLDRILSKKLIDSRSEIVLVAARRETNKFLNINFKTYLTKQIQDKHKIKMKVEIKSPSE